MGLSIITPHFNELEGLVRIYSCLAIQTSQDWEWVIVDDFSESNILSKVQEWIKNVDDRRIRFISNEKKSNASVCRNKGAEEANYDNLVFLDADDYISQDFVRSRNNEFIDFAVFINTAVDDRNGKQEIRPNLKQAYLDSFLSARFIWPITAILWNKGFFIEIGGFDSKLLRLQDVELSIRALQNSSDYKILDNQIDFFYRVKPISERQNFVKPVCDSVYLFISELLHISALTDYQKSLVSGYYYLCTKYLERSGSMSDLSLIHRNLKLFYKHGFITLAYFCLGWIILKLYSWRLVSGSNFLRINRHIFKPNAI